MVPVRIFAFLESVWDCAEESIYNRPVDAIDSSACKILRNLQAVNARALAKQETCIFGHCCSICDFAFLQHPVAAMHAIERALPVRNARNLGLQILAQGKI